MSEQTESDADTLRRAAASLREWRGASLHPIIALAVADLLDDTAGHIEYTGDETGDDVRRALAVARAYLATT